MVKITRRSKFHVLVSTICIWWALLERFGSVHGRLCSEANVIDGDILLDKAPARRRRAATAEKVKLWPGGIIPYVIADHFSNRTKDKIREAMNHWQSYTCLDFVQKTDEKDYVYIYSGKGCCSHVGRYGGRQRLSLGYRCDTFGIIVHELGHVVGFWHEQSRPDRDTYIQILYDNISKNKKYNFKKLQKEDVDSRDQRYDFHSIMHYGSNFFGKESGVDTILPKFDEIKKEELGKQYFSTYNFALSKQDVIQTNLMYQCNIFNENGGTIFAKSGSFHSPNYPYPYTVSRDRIWIITIRHSNKTSLTLIFDDFSVGSSDGSGTCKNDYLDIRNGKGFLSQYLIQLCGNKKPDPITVLGESIYIRLHSQLVTRNNYNIKKGFAVRFKTDECSRKMINMKDSFSTPRFPKRYSPNMDCIWQIRVPNGYKIKITFNEFHLKGVDNKIGCLDYVDLRDGEHPFSTFYGRFCGDNNPGIIMSTSSKFRIIFHSSSPHNETTAVGFSASYESIDIDECEEKVSECEQACVNKPGSYICGCRSGFSFVRGLHGTCVDKNECEQNNGGCSHGCENTIGGFQCTCPRGHYLVSHDKICTDIDECALNPCSHHCENFIGGFNCSCRHGYKLNEDKRTCDDINECLSFPCPFKCLNKDGSFNCICQPGRIFHRKTNSCQVLSSCNVTYSKPSGEITSPILSKPLPHNIDCIWKIQVPQVTHVSIKIDVPWRRAQNCFNYILLQYNSDESLKSKKICGKEDFREKIELKSNDIWIIYHVQTSQKTKTKISYTSSKKNVQCKKILTQSKGTIKSQRFPQKYPANTRCEWRIRNTGKHQLYLKFDFFELERESSCKYDYLEIKLRTLDRRHQRILGRYCESIERKFKISPGRELILIFNSDSTIQRRGFHAYFCSNAKLDC